MIISKHHGLKEIEDFIEDDVEIMDANEGVLLDDLIGVNEGGDVVLFRVCYLNSNASDYTVKISQSDEERADLWREWENITAHT